MFSLLAKAHTLRRLWWMNPVLAFIGVTGSTLLASIALPVKAYDLYSVPKYLTPAHLWVFVAALFAIAMGYVLATRFSKAPTPPDDSIEPLLRKAFTIAVALTFFGYLAWAGVGVKNGFRPAMIKQMATGQKVDSEDLKQTVFKTIPGVTTCTQFGIAAVAIGMWLIGRGDHRFIVPVCLVIFMAAVRAVIVSERLALIELMVPAGILFLRGKVLGQKLPGLWYVGIQAAPFIAVLGLFLAFGFFEYFRSWQHYKDQYNNIVEFTAERIMGYYATSHNNGAMALNHLDGAPFPYYTLQMVWEFPLLDQTPLGYKNLIGVDGEKWQSDLLENYANPEFNSYGGLFWPAVDFGWNGFLLYWFLFGFCAGKAYRGFLVGTAAGIFFYPLLFLVVLESPRFLYLSTVRAVPSIAYLVLVMLIYAWHSHRKLADPSQSAGSFRSLFGFFRSFFPEKLL